MIAEKEKKKVKKKKYADASSVADKNTLEEYQVAYVVQPNLELFSVKQASLWASEYLKKNVTPSNISYLVQYGKVKKIGDNGSTFIEKNDLIKYYESYNGKREVNFKDKLGDDLNWKLSFDEYKEAETTKHVHRLHPYKGKFIPQLVEYFLDNKTDNFKKEIYFKKDDIVLDPFCGSGTTLVQSAELGMHAIGIDVSAFNSLISNVKVGTYDFNDLEKEILKISKALSEFITNSKTVAFENRLLEELNKFNNKYFPVPEYKYKLHNKQIKEWEYAPEKEKLFLPVFSKLVKEYKIELKQKKSDTFLDKWFLQHIRTEIDFVFELIKKVRNKNTKKILSVILSRTIRSCRATTHSDLATLMEPITATYYCGKHGKICKPLFSILKWWDSYSTDTITRLKKFESLRKDTDQVCLTGDSRTIDIFNELKKTNPSFYRAAKNLKVKGIFSSPPYVGLIDFQEKHLCLN